MEVKAAKRNLENPARSRLVALDERGKDLTTKQFAALLGEPTAFVIGGADGLDPAIKKRAALLLRLSALTLPHALAQVVLCEADLPRRRCTSTAHMIARGIDAKGCARRFNALAPACQAPTPHVGHTTASVPMMRTGSIGRRTASSSRGPDGLDCSAQTASALLLSYPVCCRQSLPDR